ncbi:MAG: primosomal replication protein N [Nitrosomonas sp.]|nr:primosomal replication protein N [Nitrosomonas sp.]MCP5252479.1 primosomal replication protein N [Burkholderiales bacterium]MCP5291089.1 primosomal replication protein N [Burkholderiales bacterium]MDR4521280.1 primosomal replication protein N [Nitrosomonas sp.]HQU62364.1 primosomal replication protein N [Nitrosomonas sp.]
MECNQTIISGEIVRLGILRYTPAGVPAIDCIVKHHSNQREANVLRQIQCELPVVAFGESAAVMADLNIGDNIKITGFLNRKSQNNQQLVLHAGHVIQI